MEISGATAQAPAPRVRECPLSPVAPARVRLADSNKTSESWFTPLQSWTTSIMSGKFYGARPKPRKWENSTNHQTVEEGQQKCGTYGGGAASYMDFG